MISEVDIRDWKSDNDNQPEKAMESVPVVPATEAILNRWKSRALRAEMALYRAGLSDYDPSAIYSDAQWIVLCYEKKDGKMISILDLELAKRSLA